MGRMSRLLRTLVGLALAQSWILVAMMGATTLVPAEAQAARCSADAQGNWSCAHQKRYNYYFCNGISVPRAVRWQVPEGTPPNGGWPVAFYFAGTQLTDTSHAFSRRIGAPFGMELEPRIIHELLDDPYGSGRKYAVFVADPPASGGFVQFWHTNSVVPYSLSCDYDFFPDFFAEIKGGSYGAASQYNMNRRYGYGISSGGYNSSRMAVTFNSGGNANVWKALGIVSASYATCAGPLCSVPALPSNHPPTKFWHGQSDLTVPISTMYLYYNTLLQGGFVTGRLEHPEGHQFTADVLGTSGIKAWFDLR
jgi:poly(3-hydroxyoctanoate) depolymerase